MENADKNKKGFLKRLDAYLLTHMPVIWSSRIHMVVFYGLLFMLFLAGVSFIVPDDPRNEPEIYTWVIVLSIIALLAFIFWMIFLLRFNVFKRYGKWERLDSLKTFVFYFLIILLFISWPYVPPVIQSVRANMAYSTPELVNDINDMNMMICRLERDSIDLKFKADTFQVKSDMEGAQQRVERDEERGYTTYSDSYTYVDTSIMNTKLSIADSVVKLNDSVYVVYECPDFSFVYAYNLRDRYNAPLLTSMELYNDFLKERMIINNRGDIEDKLNKLIKRYTSNNKNEQWGIHGSLTDYGSKEYFYKLRDKYNLGSVNSSLSNIGERKYRWEDEAIGKSARIAYYITLIFSLLVFIYRHSTRKTFFLSLLTGVLLLIFTTLFVAISTHEGSLSGWYIFYFTLFSAVSGIIFFKKSRDALSGIALNLAFFMLPLMPFVIVNLYYFYLHRRYDYLPSIAIDKLDLFRNERLYYLLAEIGGFVLLLVLIATIVQRAYRRWYALPEQ